jgi:uncharacterized damage-inducible protein DinB
MTIVERFQTWYEAERDANEKMLTMLESVPEDHRSDPKFKKAVDLAAHLAACRENWLSRFLEEGKDPFALFPANVPLEKLRPMFAAAEAKWIAYLEAMTEEELARDFEFKGRDGNHYRWNVEGQTVSLVGHAYYHRGQIALLVDELGGKTVDTDYLFWAFPRNPKYGIVKA